MTVHVFIFVYCEVVRAEGGNISGGDTQRGIMRVIIIPDNTCYAPSQWLHGPDMTMSNYVIQSPDSLLSPPFPDSMIRDGNISILSRIFRKGYITLNRN